MIHAQGISKTYSGMRVLDGLDITVEEGQIFALLGPNGAGKTTFVKSLLGLVKPKSGTITINGIDSRSEQARQGLAYLPEKFSFYPYYKVYDVLKLYAKMQGLSGQELDDEIQKALKRVRMEDFANQRMKGLSKGQTQRIGIASTLLGPCRLLILDEPFSGLDPIGIRELKDLILDLNKEGKTIFINSHLLSEMEEVCDHLALINKGQVLAHGKIEDLTKDKGLEDFFIETVNNQGANV
jgi:ABC-type multidrug transport system ATPase subunit